MFIKLANYDFSYYAKLIEKELLANNYLWDENPQRRLYPNSPHSEMTDIWVRYGKANLHAEHESEWYPSSKVLPSVKDLAFALMTAVKGERLGGILITKLPAGGKIAPHIDSGWHANYYDKFYIPVKNEPGCIFGFESGNIVDAVPGECYYFNNHVPHWVENNSSEERIALIICIRSEGTE